MTSKLLRCATLSLLLVLLLATSVLATKRLTLSNVDGLGTVEYNSYWTGGAWIKLSAGGSVAVGNTWTIPLRATPASGYEFSQWIGNVSDSTALDPSIQMNNSDQELEVVFVPKNLVTVNLPGLGSGEVTLSDGSNTCSVSSDGGSCAFDDNSDIQLTATATGSSSFDGWSGVDSINVDGSATISIGTADRTLSATFNPPASSVRTLTLEFRGDGSGSVTLSGSSNSASTSSGGEFTFSAGDLVTLTATKDSGMLFEGWDGDIDAPSTALSITVTLDRDRDIYVTFDDPTISSVVAGCATSVGSNYASGFDANDFQLIGVSAVGGTSLQLQTGNAALDPNSIIIPFEQEVAVTFLYEGAGYKSNDLGWLYGHEDPATTTPRTIYNNINDNNNNGVLDKSGTNNSDGVTDINGDGVVNALDNRVSLGTFAAGEEIVFALTAGNNSASDPTFYTKTAWNPDTWKGGCSGSSFTKTYNLGLPLTESGCSETSNWMNQPAIDRLSDLFDLTFTASDQQTLPITRNQKFSHVIVGVPADKPNEWVLGWEDLPNGGDTDHNDVIFQIERKTGGSAELLPSEAITPLETDAYFTAVTFEVIDKMPGAGASKIAYEVSVDGGNNWVEISHWDIVKGYPLDNNGDPDTSVNLETAGVDVTESWSEGIPETTYRSVRLDFAGMGLAGDQLIWRANFTSDNEVYQPSIHDVQIDASVATHGEVSRSSPVVQTNVLYDASYETPAGSWGDKEMRGHLRAMRIYDPVDPDGTDGSGGTDYVELWDAADQLQNKSPSTRVIKYPQVSIDQVADEILATGDGITRTFSGTLTKHPVLATSVKITDTRETFIDGDINSLFGSLSQGATGTINRYTGDYEVTFDQAPGNNIDIKASYSSYLLTGNLVNFNRANTPDTVLALDDSFVNGSGYVFDFDADGDFDSADGNWLVNWTRGYADGVSSKKAGILGPIDHSTPAMVTPPGTPAWYYGTSVSLAERSAYDTYRTAHAERRAIVVAGSRNGMLHAFDAGAFRWGDNPATNHVENRGYFLWPDTSVSNHNQVESWWTDFLASLPGTNPPYFRWQNNGGKRGPDYGTGEEVWAFIPANLMPRLKNNVLGGEDRAYVDASPSVADVYIDADNDGDKEWRSVILSAEGNGGDSIFCLDVTDTQNPQFLWEYSDPELFRSRSSPSVAVIGRIYDINATETKYVAFFVSGRNYDPNAYPAVYMIDIETGAELDKIELVSPPSGKGGVPSGQPAVVDSDGNGYIDRAYIGTDKGYLYKINFPDSPTSAGVISTVLVNVDFTDEQNNKVPGSQQYQPIYGSPTVVVDNGLTAAGTIDYNIRVFFGTGDSPYYDEDINTANTKYHFYAYNDKAGKNVASNTDISLEWFYELPAGHRIFASAFAAAGQVYFGSATGETENPCDGPNEGRIFAFTYDGVSVLNDANGNPGKRVGDVYNAPVVDDEHLYLKTSDGVQSFGDGKYNNEVKKGGLPSTEATYWREIF